MAHIESFQVDSTLAQEIEDVTEWMGGNKSAAIRFLIKRGIETTDSPAAQNR